MHFELGGWRLETVAVACGQLDGQIFIPDPGVACDAGVSDPFRGGADLTVPSEPGQWVLAISSCGASFDRLGRGTCGTWYAAIVVGD